MANKHRSRVDVKQLVKTHGLIMASKTEQIRVAIFVDVCAPERLVGRVRKLFEPLKEQALLHVESFGSTAPIAPENTDLVVIVAGSSTLSSEIYDHARAKEIAVVVV